MVTKTNDYLKLWWDYMGSDERKIVRTCIGHLPSLIEMDACPEMIRVLTNFWDDQNMVFRFEDIELTPTIEEVLIFCESIEMCFKRKEKLDKNILVPTVWDRQTIKEAFLTDDDSTIDRGCFGPSGLAMLITARASVQVVKPAFYREPGRRSEKNKVLEAIIHPSAELSYNSVPSSAPTSKISKQTQSNRTVAPKRAQEKRLVTNSPRPRTSDCIKRNNDFKAEDKTKADSWQSGSISFGRFENEALCWERRSSFTHNRTTTLLENEKYQASENEGYAGRFEQVNGVGYFARFDENYDSSTHLSKNGKYQVENTDYDGYSERVNEVSDLAHFKKSLDGSNSGDIKVTECGGERSSNGDIEVIECGREDSISCHSGPQTEQDTNSPDVLQSVPEFWKLKQNLISVQKIQLLMIQRTEEQPIARKVVASRASCTEKVSHRLYQSVNRDKESVKSCQPGMKQNGSSFYFKTEERARKRKEFLIKIEEKMHAKEEETRQLQARIQEKKEAEIKQLWRNLNFKATPMPTFYRELDHRSEKTKVSSSSKANVLNQHKSTEEYPIARKVVASHAFRTEEVSSSSKANVLNQHKSTEEYPIARKVVASHAFRTEEENKEVEIKQLRKNLNFKATPMPAFYREPGRRPEKNKDGQSWEEAGARAAVRAGARATSATENTVRCLRAEVYNRCSTNEHLSVADSPQVLEVTIHPSAELSDSSVPSVATSKTSKQTQLNRTVAPKGEQEKRQVANYPRPRTSDSIRRNKDFKTEDKTKNLAQRTETMQRERMLEVWT
ncbi:hypothetical protein BC332_00005 [Capsicum chinense]|nr:hypothetical protein BC332_00005 [Capsicum chinense]